jgi:phosphonoacetate hydrolase
MSIVVNGRTYRQPTSPTVVICFDGFDPAYLERGIEDGILPNLARMCASGFRATADAAMPTFTNPNNMSIVTGAPPAVHGIAGNYYLDRATGKEVMITDDTLVRSETILAALEKGGTPVAVVTAKDKLRKMLGHGLNGICFSSEKAATANRAENAIDDVEALVGRKTPDMYSPDLSLFVLDAGLVLLKQKKAKLFYLSLSDMVQHAAGPGEALADDFHAKVDQRIGQMLELGATVGVVADHGMNDKCDAAGNPSVVFLETELNKALGRDAVRVICPITDPYVKHHGALGSFVRVYVKDHASLAQAMEAAGRIPGIALVVERSVAASRYDLPYDIEGDFVAIADTYATIGSRREEHDLAGLNGHRLRSHGGLSEQSVPFVLSKPLNGHYQEVARSRRLRNFDIFEFALNAVESKA